MEIGVGLISIVPNSTNCPFGYNYNVKFSYSITVSGVNTCYNGDVGVQVQIICNNQDNVYTTIYVPAPVVGSPGKVANFKGQLTTASNPYNTASDCNTATPASLNCNALRVTVFGPGIPATTYSCALLALPIELISFTGQCEQENVSLKWSTATESNNDYFTLEHSTDAINWTITGTVDGAGNASTQQNYTYLDTKSYTGISYYRLKQTDFSGDFNYSGIIDVKNCKGDLSSELTIYPSPSNGVLHLLFNGNIDQIRSTGIYNVMGKRVYYSERYQPTIDLSSLQNGIYMVRVDLDSKILTKKCIVAR